MLFRFHRLPIILSFNDIPLQEVKGQNPHIIFTLTGITMILVTGSCIEPFQAETLGLENVLVVDARLTDEVKKHQILLSRARPFDKDNIIPERNAEVSIVENSETSYAFEEMNPGHYVSTMTFGAKTNQSYQLKITTSDGSYASTMETMPQNVPIANLDIKRGTNDLGEDGVVVVLDNTSLGNQPRYFRYDYEESYKIVAPNWDPFEFEIIDSVACTDGDAFEVRIKPKHSLKGQTCYGQQSSTKIILASTANLDGNTVSDFRVHFVNRENYILTHRYSILVNQYTQSVDAHSYYQGLQAFSTSESVFSEIQPGFLPGNIFSETDTAEKVVGYFETAAVSSKRVFFDYQDIFPEEPLPEYPINCSSLGNPRLIGRSYHCTMGNSGVCDGSCKSPLIDQIQANLIVFAAEKEPTDILAPFLTLPVACGDCTVLGSNLKPDFWID